MALDLRAPGVYLEERFVRAPAALPTGVPAFVGFGRARDEAGALSDEPQLLVHPDQVDGRWVPRANGRSHVAAAVKGFFAQGGKRCYLRGAGDPDVGDPPLPPQAAAADVDGGERRLGDALDNLTPLEDLDLVAIPDAVLLPDEAALRVQGRLVKHCNDAGDRVAVLDPLWSSVIDGDPVAALDRWRTGLLGAGTDGASAAVYFPWVRPAGADDPVPPCGHAAGIVARSDLQTGVFKAPANEELVGVVDLAAIVDAQAHGDLNRAGVNCVRAIPGRGLRVLGARTLSQDPDWRYLNVRRTFLTLGRWIDQNMAWATFEPNTPRLWNRIQRELGTYLAGWWRAGGLQGATAQEAYYVRCDAETNPQESRDLGQVITEVGLAPAAPAEFIVVSVTQRAGSTQLS